MRRKRLIWQLYPSYLLITVLSLVAVSVYASRSMHRSWLRATAADLETRAILMRDDVSGQMPTGSPDSVDRLCKRLGKKSSTRITVILPTGRVIGDSEEDPARMENHADRPEIITALSGKAGFSTRYSPTLKINMMYAAVPLAHDGKIVAVVRTSLPLTSIDAAMRALYARIASGGLVVAIVAAAVSLLVSRRISRPIEEMRHVAEQFAKGEFTKRLAVHQSQEIGGLAEAMNEMAVQLDGRISTTLRQRNELEAVLASMIEGVLAIDPDEKIIGMNEAAARMLGVDPERTRGQSIQEAVRNIDLHDFAAQAISASQPVEGELRFADGGELFVQAHGTLLRDADGKRIGAVVVLNDVTRLRGLESMRRQFVANVSHELKTPITSIRGFVETLLEGALKDEADAKRFLGIIARQADRLNAIIEDLLLLSRIEQDTDRAGVELQETRIGDVLTAAVELCEPKSRAKDITVRVVCPEELTHSINAALLEQGVVNLTDNAIKYSEPGSTVEVEAEKTDSEVVLSVADRGCGIEPEHLPRLFERFYRVDKGRSRKLGGTGLGLAIVKHIAIAHGGRVSVDSRPGRGSVFRIHLPLRARRDEGDQT
jgi:two-component system phosphate regulon sensor histidine kinase PhoR